jgi:lipopolysaccharide transport system permease protein/teichoic acid transport system permease protein
MGYHFFLFLKDLFKSRRLIWELTKKDFKTRYLGTYLGLLWAFVQPTVTILIFWFVFQVGFKATPIDNFPFILWIVTGMIPWFFIADSIPSATQSILDNSFLVNKVVFRTSILPIVKISSALIIHLFFIAMTFLLFILLGYLPDMYGLQLIYYLFSLIIFVLGISWITSSLVVFLRDVGYVIGMFLQFGFWITPIFWSLKIVPEQYQAVIKLNPLFYIIEGYRDSLIYKTWFWEHQGQTMYFWMTTIIIFVSGAVIFRKLRPHFADVL